MDGHILVDLHEFEVESGDLNGAVGIEARREWLSRIERDYGLSPRNLRKVDT